MAFIDSLLKYVYSYIYTVIKLIRLIRTFLLRNFVELYQKGPYEAIPKPIQNILKII